MITLSKKVCLLGDSSVGKTCLVRRFVYNIFEDRYLNTIGVKVSRKVVAVPKQDILVELTLTLWDLADSEEFDRVRVSYLRGAAGVVVVCDIARPATVDGLYRYSRDLRAISPEAHLILAANKTDLTDPWLLSEEQIRAAARGSSRALLPDQREDG